MLKALASIVPSVYNWDLPKPIYLWLASAQARVPVTSLPFTSPPKKKKIMGFLTFKLSGVLPVGDIANSNFTMISLPLQQGINNIFVQNNCNLEIYNGLIFGTKMQLLNIHLIYWTYICKENTILFRQLEIIYMWILPCINYRHLCDLKCLSSKEKNSSTARYELKNLFLSHYYCTGILIVTQLQTPDF